MAPGRTGHSQPGTPRNAPNPVLRHVRERERTETREQFAASMSRIAREIGASVCPDEQYVARLEAGEIRYPGPTYRRILAELCGRPFSELGFDPPPGLSVPSSQDSRDAESMVADKAASSVGSRINMELRNAVLSSGLEVAQIARAIGVDPKTVQRWITRGVVPHPRYRWKVCEVLERQELEIWPQVGTPPQPDTRYSENHPDTAAIRRDDAEDMERRQLLQNLTALGVSISPLGQALEPVRAALGRSADYDDRNHLDHWEAAVAEYGYTYLASSPGTLIPDLAADLVAVRSVLGRIPGEGSEYRSWCRVAGTLSGLLAKSLSNLGQSRHSRQWWNMAQHLTDASGDLNLSLWARGQRIIHGLYENRPFLMLLRQAEAAREFAHGYVCTGLADVSTSLAQVSVLSGDHRTAEEELRRSDAILSQLPRSVTEETSSIMGWGEAQLRYTEAWVYAHMGDEAKTDLAIERALSLYPESDNRSPAQIRLMQGFARIRSGDITEGIRHAQTAYGSLGSELRTTMVDALAQRVLSSVPAEARNRSDVANYRALVSQSSSRMIES